MKNRGPWHDLHCPMCKSTTIAVVVSSWAVLTEDGSDTLHDRCPDNDHEWGDESTAQCLDCKHSSTVDYFRATNPDPVHTPGPWRVLGRCHNQAEAFAIGTTLRTVAWSANTYREDGTYEEVTDEDVANTNILAAALDTLEACEQVLDAGDDNGDMSDIDWDQLRDAVNKARGRI